MINPNQMSEVLLFVRSKMADDTNLRSNPVSILHKSIAGRLRPVRVADGPLTARCRFM